MTRPGLIALDPALLTDFVFEVDERNIVTFRLWIRKRDGTWCAVGPEDTDQVKAHQWLFVPPLQVDGTFAYSFSVWGRPFARDAGVQNLAEFSKCAGKTGEDPNIEASIAEARRIGG